MRGYLDESIFDAIEHTLREHGAPAVDRGMGGTFAEQLDDAIYRSGLIGSNGLAIEIENLSAISDVHNTLHPDDGRTLSQWLDATQSHAVQLLLPPSVRTLKVFPDAVPLDQLLPLSTLASLPAVIEYEPARSIQRHERYSNRATKMPRRPRCCRPPGKLSRSQRTLRKRRKRRKERTSRTISRWSSAMPAARKRSQ
jgi:hypothetical protein